MRPAVADVLSGLTLSFFFPNGQAFIGSLRPYEYDEGDVGESEYGRGWFEFTHFRSLHPLTGETPVLYPEPIPDTSMHATWITDHEQLHRSIAVVGYAS
jgi:hypothetical protein